MVERACAALHPLRSFVMRFKALMALVAIALTIPLAAQRASAFGLDSPDLRYHQYHPQADRYPYYYDPRGWYPYYNSGEWGRPYISRYRGELPPYYAAWGSNNRRYHHVEWHRRHYGGHRRGDW
jgi:hypothetical protein